MCTRDRAVNRSITFRPTEGAEPKTGPSQHPISFFLCLFGQLDLSNDILASEHLRPHSRIRPLPTQQCASAMIVCSRLLLCRLFIVLFVLSFHSFSFIHSFFHSFFMLVLSSMILPLFSLILVCSHVTIHQCLNARLRAGRLLANTRPEVQPISCLRRLEGI